MLPVTTALHNLGSLCRNAPTISAGVFQNNGCSLRVGVRRLVVNHAVVPKRCLRSGARSVARGQEMLVSGKPTKEVTKEEEHATLTSTSTSSLSTTTTTTTTKIVALDFPTIEDAKQLPFAYRKMDNVSLVTLGGMGEHAARKEILIRHIMAVDEVPYEKAFHIFQNIEAANDKGIYMLGLPFKIGAVAMVLSGVIAIPLVFHQPTVEWFNEQYVTMDAPPPKDLETWLEVGAWSWNWMEPLLGTSTFVLMCMQYFRLNMDQLGIKPYTQRLRNMRAERLAQQFPAYDREVLMNFSETATIYKASS